MNDLTSQNKALLHNYHEHIWNGKKLDLLPEFIADDFSSHAVPANAPKGWEPIKEFLELFFTAFPDLHSDENILIGEEDKVAIEWTIRATHQADFMGVKAANKPVVVSGIDILRIENGKFIEHWGGIGDQMPKILEQIG